jgi:uncharacterized protein
MPQNNSELLDIEVAYATPDREIIIALKLPRGSSANDAIERSGILQKAPKIDLAKNKIGIYGKLCSLNYVLYQHDRVEIYRPLTIDPKEIRRLRAGKNQSKAK